jgi:TusA-related sulfurtransferase
VTEPGENDRLLDLRGVPCPVTWARAKAVLEGLAPGTCVTVLTDDRRSARDLPAAAEAEGYAVLATREEGATTFIRIER